MVDIISQWRNDWLYVCILKIDEYIQLYVFKKNESKSFFSECLISPGLTKLIKFRIELIMKSNSLTFIHGT
jgi:hypothetical protein